MIHQRLVTEAICLVQIREVVEAGRSLAVTSTWNNVLETLLRDNRPIARETHEAQAVKRTKPTICATELHRQPAPELDRRRRQARAWFQSEARRRD
jgi:hypothetical protein